MDEARLALLASATCCFRVVERDGRIAAFLMAFRRGANYDGAVFKTFEQDPRDFIYVDRVAVEPTYQGKGIAKLLYDDVGDYARSAGVGRLTAEINVVPPNEASMRFHLSRGFREIGRLELGAKTVALCECAI